MYKTVIIDRFLDSLEKAQISDVRFLMYEPDLHDKALIHLYRQNIGLYVNSAIKPRGAPTMSSKSLLDGIKKARESISQGFYLDSEIGLYVNEGNFRKSKKTTYHLHDDIVVDVIDGFNGLELPVGSVLTDETIDAIVKEFEAV